MKSIMSETEAFRLLNADGMQVGHVEQEISQFSETRHKVRCANPCRAKDIMFQARQIGVDAFSRGAVVTFILMSWQVSLISKLDILAGKN